MDTTASGTSFPLRRLLTATAFCAGLSLWSRQFGTGVLILIGIAAAAGVVLGTLSVVTTDWILPLAARVRGNGDRPLASPWRVAVLIAQGVIGAVVLWSVMWGVANRTFKIKSAEYSPQTIVRVVDANGDRHSRFHLELAAVFGTLGAAANIATNHWRGARVWFWGFLPATLQCIALCTMALMIASCVVDPFPRAPLPFFLILPIFVVCWITPFVFVTMLLWSAATFLFVTHPGPERARRITSEIAAYAAIAALVVFGWKAV